MALLDEVLQASGGLELWRQLGRFTLHMSIRGALCSRMCASALLNGVVVEGRFREQALEITGFTAPNRRASYRPDWVALERSDGELLKERHATVAEFRHDLKAASWDELLLTFFCGSLIWSHLHVPFVLADADVSSTELPPVTESGTTLRPLQILFPERLTTAAPENTFYFDTQSLLRRQEYTAPQDERLRIAQVFSGYQRYSGIPVPTLSRLLARGPDGEIIQRPPLVDIEIFEASFE